MDVAAFGRSEILAATSAVASPQITTTISTLQNELEHRADYSQEVQQGLLLQLVALLLRALKTGESEAASGSTSARVMFYLRENYAQNLTLSDIARHTHFSPNYLASIFKQETGQTIFDALAKIRIEHATRLLLEDKLPVYEIAKAVGYNSLDRFSRVFRQLKGVPPSLYGQNSPRS